MKWAVSYQLHLSRDFAWDTFQLEMEYSDISPELGRRFLESVKQVSNLIRDLPLLGSTLPTARFPNLRVRGVPRFREYVILYSLDGEDVTLIRLVHGARDLTSLLDE